MNNIYDYIKHQILFIQLKVGIAKLAREIGVDRKTVYSWLQKPSSMTMFYYTKLDAYYQTLLKGE